MSIYYSPRLVHLLMDERVREAREANRHSCPDLESDEPKSSFRDSILNAFRRETPAPCAC
jgi:hypothetical protein